MQKKWIWDIEKLRYLLKNFKKQAKDFLKENKNINIKVSEFITIIFMKFTKLFIFIITFIFKNISLRYGNNIDNSMDYIHHICFICDMVYQQHI